MLKRNKFLCLLLLFSIILNLNSMNVQASVNVNRNQDINQEDYSNQIDLNIVNREISKWDKTETYHYRDLVLHQNKIYFASKNIQGLVPGKSKSWLFKADLSVYESDNKSLDLYKNSSLFRTAAAKIIAYNAELSRNKYQYAIRALMPGHWTAQVNSVIHYDNGKHVIIKNDFFNDNILMPTISQVKKYYYSGITKVTVVLSGTFQGKTLKSTGATMYP